MAGPTDDYAAVAQYIKGLYDIDVTLGLQEVYYGDQEKIGKTPALVIEPGPQESQNVGANHRMEHTFTVYIILYLARVQPKQANRTELDAMVKKAVTILQADKQLGVLPDNLVINSSVVRREPGYARKGGALLNAARITWQGMSLTYV